jgi:hypothetical protein
VIIKLWPSPKSVGIERFIEAVSMSRREDVVEFNSLNNRLLRGRLRSDRAVPTSSTNVVGGDQEGDIVRSGTYEYIVVNSSGTLKWARHALDSTW